MTKTSLLTLALSLTGVLTSPLGHTEEPTQSELINGSRIWQQNCARCHNLRRAESYSDRDWEIISNHMRLRAGLSGSETETLARFLKTIN